MPATFQIDPNRRRVSITLSGVIESTDLAAVGRQRRDSIDDDTFDELIDVTEVVWFDVPKDRVVDQAVRSLFRTTNRRADVARDPVQFRLLKVLYAHIEGREAQGRIFSKRTAAEAWLEGREPR